MTRLFLLIAALCSSAFAAPPTHPRANSLGILLLAHGSGPEWDAQVSRLRRETNAAIPTETAFGMADPDTIQAALDALKSRGVLRVAAVPLFVNSRSEVMDQTRYVLGLSPAPSQVFIRAMKEIPMSVRGMDGMNFDPNKKAAFGIPLVLTPALDDDPLVADILISRARELSRDPARETVILVGHGPVDDAENLIWLATMKRLCLRIQKAGRFKAALAFTIRDDSQPAVKAKAEAALRRAVQRASQNGGRAIVIPDLIARGGIEGHITAALSGLSYAWDDKPLCPDARLKLWILKRAKAAFPRR